MNGTAMNATNTTDTAMNATDTVWNALNATAQDETIDDDLESELSDMMILNRFVEFNLENNDNDSDDESTFLTLNSNNQVRSLATHIRKQGLLLDVVVQKRNELEDKVSERAVNRETASER